MIRMLNEQAKFPSGKPFPLKIGIILLVLYLTYRHYQSLLQNKLNT